MMINALYICVWLCADTQSSQPASPLDRIAALPEWHADRALSPDEVDAYLNAAQALQSWSERVRIDLAGRLSPDAELDIPGAGSLRNRLLLLYRFAFDISPNDTWPRLLISPSPDLLPRPGDPWGIPGWPVLWYGPHCQMASRRLFDRDTRDPRWDYERLRAQFRWRDLKGVPRLGVNLPESQVIQPAALEDSALKALDACVKAAGSSRRAMVSARVEQIKNSLRKGEAPSQLPVCIAAAMTDTR